MLSKNKKSPENDKTIHIPPIAVILVCGTLIILCLIILIVRISSNKDNEDFKRSAVYAEAVINGKTMYTIDEDGRNVYHYLTDTFVSVDYGIEFFIKIFPRGRTRERKRACRRSGRSVASWQRTSETGIESQIANALSSMK